MTHTQNPHSVTDVLARIAWPLLFFSIVLFGLLALSWTLLLPRYTSIAVGDTLRTPEQLVRYKAELEATIAAKEEDRRKLVLAVHDESYDALKDRRRSRLSILELQDALTDAVKKITNKDGTVQWSGLTYDPDAKTLTVQGDIRNVDTRSMTVLAEFTESLKTLPFVASNTTPVFTRQEDKDIGFHSPFEITITLK